MGSGELIALLVTERLRLQTVRDAIMRRGTRRGATSGQQNRLRGTNSPLVHEQHVIGASAVAEMLVDVDDRLACGLLCGCVIRRGCADERQSGGREKIPAVHADSLIMAALHSPGVYSPVLDFHSNHSFMGGRT